MKRTIAKRVALGGMLVAVAFMFSYLELLIPISFGIPGIKLGLANLVILSCMYVMQPLEVFVILLARILLSGFLFGNMTMMIYSLAGGVLSFLIMLFVKKTQVFSMIGASMLGGVFHNIGQIITAMLVVSNVRIITYLPVLLLSGVVSGLLIGLLSKKCVPVVKRFYFT